MEGRVFDLGYATDFQAGDSVVTLFVFEQVDRTREPLAQPAYLAVDPSDTNKFVIENVRLTGSNQGVLQIDLSTYAYFSRPDSNRHYVVFNSRRLQGRAVGAYMEIKRANGDTVEIGSIPSDTTWVLKLLYHNSPSPQHRTWDLMWRNCYGIPRGVSMEDVDIKVFKGVPGAEGTSSSLDYQELNGETQSYIEILGLDQYNSAGQKIPDSRFDDRSEIFRPDWGLLIFPHRTPFATDTTYIDENGNATQPLQETVPIIYNYTFPVERTQASQYYLQISTRSGY